MGALGETFDWPVPITMMLSLAAGITVSISGNKLLFKNADGIEIGSKTLSDDEIKIVEKEIEKNTRTEILSSEEAEEIAFNAIQGADKADTVVLGKFDALKDANENLFMMQMEILYQQINLIIKLQNKWEHSIFSWIIGMNLLLNMMIMKFGK